MFNQYLKRQIETIDAEVKNSTFDSFKLPKYDPKTHYIELTHSGYFYALIALRQNLKIIADHRGSGSPAPSNIRKNLRR
jgi:hypothetical protein